MAIRGHRGVSHPVAFVARCCANGRVGVAHLTRLASKGLHALLVRGVPTCVVLHLLRSVPFLSLSARFDSLLDWC